MSYHKRKWQVMRAVLINLQRGATHTAACKAAGISDSSWWSWKAADPRLAKLADKVINSRIEYVVDALYKSAVQGSVQAQKYYLNNRCRGKWQDSPDIVINTGDDNSKHLTQIFQQAPSKIVFDDGDGDRRIGINDIPPEDCVATPPDESILITATAVDMPVGEEAPCPENPLP